MERILFILAILTFSMISLSTNNDILDRQVLVFQSEAIINAVGVAEQILEEISLESFDEETTNSQRVSSAGDLTSVLSLGSDGLEPSDDDIDDYDGRVISFDAGRIPGFQAIIDVAYADTSNPSLDAISPTYAKRVRISITNPDFMTDSLRIERLFTYY